MLVKHNVTGKRYMIYGALASPRKLENAWLLRPYGHSGHPLEIKNRAELNRLFTKVQSHETARST